MSLCRCVIGGASRAKPLALKGVGGFSLCPGPVGEFLSCQVRKGVLGGAVRPGSTWEPQKRKASEPVKPCATRSGLYSENRFEGYEDMGGTHWEASAGVRRVAREAEGEQSGGGCWVLGREAQGADEMQVGAPEVGRRRAISPPREAGEADVHLLCWSLCRILMAGLLGLWLGAESGGGRELLPASQQRQCGSQRCQLPLWAVDAVVTL